MRSFEREDRKALFVRSTVVLSFGSNDTSSLPLSAMREARPGGGTNHQPHRQRFHRRSASARSDLRGVRGRHRPNSKGLRCDARISAGFKGFCRADFVPALTFFRDSDIRGRRRGPRAESWLARFARADDDARPRASARRPVRCTARYGQWARAPEATSETWHVSSGRPGGHRLVASGAHLLTRIGRCA